MILRVRELTPPGSGAVSVLAISGKGALEAVRTLSTAEAIPIGRPSRLLLRADGEDLDETIVCASSPDEVELHLHGSPALVRRVIACFGAEAGRDARVATIEEIASELLAGAPCEAAARILLDQADGALARDLESLLHLDDHGRGRAIDALLARGRIARWALGPATIVIAGRANAGKSTLFNALLGERRALVDAAPGTTRDLNRAPARLGSWPVILVDTAGDRELGAAREDPATQASIERRGQERALAARAAADLVLWLEPIGLETTELSPVPAGSGERSILVRTFADRVGPRPRPALAISALADPNAARELVATVFRATFALPEDPWAPGAGVPFLKGLGREIEGLRPLSPPALARAIDCLLRRPRALPGPGCTDADDPVACTPGSA